MCFAGVVVAVWEERGFLSFFGLLWVPQELLGANPARHRVDNCVERNAGGSVRDWLV